MRTTLTIDDDVLAAAQERARRESRPTGDVISELAREALIGRHRAAPQSTSNHHGFRPLPSRGLPVSNSLIDRLREDDLA
ncbi:MAG: antitoxin [Candidatus Nanopelagicales bacterium]